MAKQCQQQKNGTHGHRHRHIHRHTHTHTFFPAQKKINLHVLAFHVFCRVVEKAHCLVFPVGGCTPPPCVCKPRFFLGPHIHTTELLSWSSCQSLQAKTTKTDKLLQEKKQILPTLENRCVCGGGGVIATHTLNTIRIRLVLNFCPLRAHELSPRG